MRVLLDNNVNHRLARLIQGHEVIHARAMGWSELYNGHLIATAEEHGFDVMVTADKQMRHQQNLTGRNLSIIALNSLFITWPSIAPWSQSFKKGWTPPYSAAPSSSSKQVSLDTAKTEGKSVGKATGEHALTASFSIDTGFGTHAREIPCPCAPCRRKSSPEPHRCPFA